MLKQRTAQEVFIDRFTEEIILVVKSRQEELERERKEKERLKRVIEIEKLKKRFAEYLKTAKPEEIKKAKVPIIRPEAPKIAKPEIKPEEKIAPSILQPAVLPAPAIPVAPSPIPAPPILPKMPPRPAPRRELPVEKVPLPTVPTVAPGEIDFGKVAGFVKDPLVTYIECPGEGKNVVIKKAGKVIRTQVTLKKDEIKNIIISFSEKVRIPLVEGVLCARYQHIEISAVVSDVISPSFIIKKDIIPPLEKPETRLMSPRMPVTVTPRVQQPMPPVARPFTMVPGIPSTAPTTTPSR